MRLGYLSEKYEGAGPDTISTGEGDSGGVSYGTYQLATNTGSVVAFVNWLLNRHDYGKGYGEYLQPYEPGTAEFSEAWRHLAKTDRDGFATLQDEYAKPQYYEAAANMLRSRDIEPDNWPEALQMSLFANAVQHGPFYAAQLFAEAMQHTSEPEDILWNVYQIKLTDMSWSKGAESLRPGLFARWQSERDDAIKILKGEYEV